MFLTACAPNLGAAPELREIASLAPADDFAAAGEPSGAWPAQQWWRAYNDPQLDALIEEALADAPDMAAAAARLRRAQAAAQIAGAARRPSLSADAEVASVRQSLNTGFPDEFKSVLPQGWNSEASASLRLEQDIDLFGRTRAAVSAARYDAEAAAANAAAARLTLSTQIALAYADLARLTADRTALEDVLQIRTQSADLVRRRHEAGLENDGGLSQAQSEVSAAQASLLAVEAEQAQARNRIAALLGKGPDRALAIEAPAEIAITPAAVPQNLSADLVGRRADIVMSRMAAEAAAARVRVARADYYPNINLTAVVGLQSLGLDTFAEGDSRYGSIGPAVHLPLFASGQLNGSYRAARAGYDESVAIYNATLANALRDVSDALIAKRALDAQLVQMRQAYADAENAHRVARARYEGGLSTYIDALAVENSLVQRRRALADLEAQTFSVDVALVRALGGGFNIENTDQTETSRSALDGR